MFHFLLIKKMRCILVVLIFIFGLFGCARTPTPQEIAGEYVYLYQSGEVEVWILKDNLTYSQEFYHTIKEYHYYENSAFTNSGTFSIKNNIITFDRPLGFNPSGIATNALAQPLTYRSETGNWVPQTDERVAAIWIYQEGGYGLFKMSKRSDVIDDKERR